MKRVRIEEAVEGIEMEVGGKGERKRDFISGASGGDDDDGRGRVL